MKPMVAMVLGLTGQLLCSSAAFAEIEIVKATLTKGQIEITGNRAQASSPIFWEGASTGVSSNPGGTFKFATTLRPRSCAGALRRSEDRKRAADRRN